MWTQHTICVHTCAHTLRTRAHAHTHQETPLETWARTTLVNTQHVPPAVTTEKGQRKPGSDSSEHENLSQNTITRLCSLLSWRLNPELELLDDVSSTSIINQTPRHLFLHAPTATNASQRLLSSPLFLTSPRSQQKPEVLSRASIPFPTAGGKWREEPLPWWSFSTIYEEENGSSKSDCTQPSTSMNPKRKS